MIPALLTALAAPQLRRYIARRVPADDVDDVLQDVALSALLGLDRYEDRGHAMTAWLYRIAHSRIIDRLRQDARRPTCELWDMAAPDFAGAVDDRADAAWLWPAVDALPPNQRAVLRARYELGLGLHETAAALGLTAGAVKSAQHRGLAGLRITVNRVD